jgi:transcriptional regulator with XRE-family HTH domain
MTTSPLEFRVYDAEGFGGAVRHFREEAGLTQAQLAEMIGVPRTYVVELEGGATTEQARRVVALLKAVGARVVVTKADW